LACVGSAGPLARGAGLERRWADSVCLEGSNPSTSVVEKGRDDDVAEWRGAGLQSRRRGFDSRRRLVKREEALTLFGAGTGLENRGACDACFAGSNPAASVEVLFTTET
jgi:hypothetical protein